MCPHERRELADDLHLRGICRQHDLQQVVISGEGGEVQEALDRRELEDETMKIALKIACKPLKIH